MTASHLDTCSNYKMQLRAFDFFYSESSRNQDDGLPCQFGHRAHYANEHVINLV